MSDDNNTVSSKDDIIALLRKESSELKDTVAVLTQALAREEASSTTFYASPYSRVRTDQLHDIPTHGMSARFAKQVIEDLHLCDFRPRLNTSSYVNVVLEEEEKEVALLGNMVNLADASVYPASVHLHNLVVNLLAKLWNAPDPAVKEGNYTGAGTVGSTEACLLAGTE